MAKGRKVRPSLAEQGYVEFSQFQPAVLFYLILKQAPPRPTLFPYTTLFRSDHINFTGVNPLFGHPQRRFVDMVRSEEHTSELQSHSELVCRLLLEKKKSKRFSSCPRIGRIFSFSASSPLRFNS